MEKMNIENADDILTPEIRENQLTELSDSMQFDKENFAQVLREIKGCRSVRQYAIDTDLSDSFISKAICGFVENSPSKRTMLKLLGDRNATVANRRKLLLAAGYPDDSFNWNNLIVGSKEYHDVSTAEIIAKYYGGNHFLAMGRLMKGLADHGVKGDLSSYFYHKDGYFEIKDEETGQVFVGVNIFCDIEADKEKARFNLIFSLALTLSKIKMSDRANEKIVVIMTNDEEIFIGCQTIGQDNMVKAVKVVLTDDYKGFRKEVNLVGECPISLVD